MRKRIWITCIVILAVCIVLLLFNTTQHQKTSLTEQGQTPTNQPNQQEQTKAVKALQTLNSSKTAAVPPVTVAPSAPVAGSNAADPRVLAEWQVPIEFYGKVVDEKSNEVAGAKITFQWVETPTQDGTRTSATESDAEGLFSLHDKRGPSLIVWVSKEGYYASHHGQWGFSYALGQDIHSPDPQNPVIFNLRKKGQGVYLITSENGVRLKVDVRVPRDNSPVRVDLLQKQPSAAGQLEISQNKPPWREATEWSFRMSILDGGFVADEDEFQFEAPRTNYVPTVEYHFTRSETNWMTHVTKRFYITFGQPRKYGWLRIESDIAQETIFLTYAINPSGSRNLEPAN